LDFDWSETLNQHKIKHLETSGKISVRSS
jgi:hypothetical protein